MYRLKAEFPRDIDPIFRGNQQHICISLCIEKVKKLVLPVELYSNTIKSKKQPPKRTPESWTKSLL